MSDVRLPSTAHLPRLLHPATLLLIVSDVLPIVGVLFWHWDAFLILMLYWMETAAIGFWTILRIATMATTPARGAGDGERRAAGGIVVALFFVFHSGVFMAVHFMFLWALTAGAWAQRINGPGDFFAQVVWATGLWVPLGILFLSRGLWFYCQLTGWNPAQALERFLWGRATTPAEPIADAGAILGRFYGRIILMQFAIILGAFLSFQFGSMAPLVVMIALKTVFDIATGGAGLHDGTVKFAA